MRYTFPKIETLDDVLPYLNDNFYVAEKDGYTVVNYRAMTRETFPDIGTPGAEILRECRGLIFDSVTRKVISRRFHKFFNLNEREETFEHLLKDKAILTAYEKLDGSMIAPFVLDDQIRLGTKAGITDISMQAERWVSKNNNYQDFLKRCVAMEATPIFEWCSRQNKVVVDHPVDRLVLLDVRTTVSGQYSSRLTLEEFSKNYGIELVKEISGTQEEVRETLKTSETVEGVVLQYPDGHRVKVKTEWYLQLHRAKESLTRERDVVLLMLDEKLDDLKPLLPPEDLRRLEEFEIKFWMSFSLSDEILYRLFQKAIQMNRKDFAILQNSDSSSNKRLTSLVFKMLDTNPEDLNPEKTIITEAITRMPQASGEFSRRLRELLDFNFDWQMELPE